jgi:hypothetical protein
MSDPIPLAKPTLPTAPPAAPAGPVPAAERIPVDIRRTTLVVRDIDKSLALYRDALGLTLIYNTPIAAVVSTRTAGPLPPAYGWCCCAPTTAASAPAAAAN